jgi:hypothetical protein
LAKPRHKENLKNPHPGETYQLIMINSNRQHSNVDSGVGLISQSAIRPDGA